MTELEYDALKIKIERENEEKLKHYPILEEQLEIAVKCLEIYALENLVVVSKDGSFTMELKNGSYSRAKQALKEIEALNEIHKQE
jgi:hypothetical protein